MVPGSWRLCLGGELEVNPLVSICIPAFNNAEHIEQAVHSALNQTYAAIEVVVVDDASADDTYELVKAIEDPRIKLSRNLLNLGLAGNWNHSIEIAQGDFIKLMGADDVLEPTAIEKELQALLDNPAAVLAESNSKVVNADGRHHGTFRRYWRKGLVPGRRVAIDCTRTVDLFGSPVANLIRASVLEKVGGFDPTFVYITDYDLFMSIACQGDIFIIGESLNQFRVRKGANTSKVMGGGEEAAYLAEHRRMLEKHRAGLSLTNFDIWLSMLSRRVWSFMVGVYLRMFVR